jgi:hypothetical protein
VSGLVHCPVCSTAYPAGTSICMNDSSILVEGPPPDAEDELDEDEASDESDEIDELSGLGRLEVVPMDEPEEEELGDLFELEEHPRRIVLVVMVPEDAPDLIERLEAEGIGARLGEPTDDDGVQVLIHEMNVMEAQAILVDFTGDPSLAVDIDPGGAGDHGGYELVFQGHGSATANVDRLRDAGIDVRLEVGEEGPMQPWAIRCPSDDVQRARDLLGVQR